MLDHQLDGRAPAPFVVLCLPRSRSAWMAHWLSYGQATVGHDTLLQCDTAADWQGLFAEGMLGAVETAGVEGWRLMQSMGLRMAVVLRSPEKVLKSLELKGLPLALAAPQIELRCAMLLQVAKQEGVLTVDCEGLSTGDGAKLLWDFCHPEVPFDYDWWEHMNRLNIQINWPERMEQLSLRAPAMASLRTEVASLTQKLEAPITCH